MMHRLREGYKQTKVGVIPEEWDTHRIDRVLLRIRKKVEVEKEVMYQQIGIRSHAKGIFHKELVSGEALGNKSVFWIEEDAFIVNIVFAWEQAVAKTTSAEKGMIASHRFPMYKAKDNKVDIDYILYFFKSKRGKHLLGLASPGGAGRNKTLGQKEFSELKLPLPPLKEQQKIAQILSTWDSAISKQEALIEAKEQLKKGLMQKLLSGEVRFEGFDGEWEEVRLGDLSDIKTGSSNREDSTEEDGKYTFFDRSEDIRTSSRYLFEGEAVIVAGEGQRFLPKYFIGKFDLHQRTYSIMNFKKSMGKYIFYYIWKNSNYFLAQAVGSTVKSLRLPMFKKMKIKLPPLKEQQKIAQVLSIADKEIALLKNELETLKEQKRGLMQRLLSGDVRVMV